MALVNYRRHPVIIPNRWAPSPFPARGMDLGTYTTNWTPYKLIGSLRYAGRNADMVISKKNKPTLTSSGSCELTKDNLFRGVSITSFLWSHALATREVIFEVTNPLDLASWWIYLSSIRGEACWLPAQAMYNLCTSLAWQVLIRARGWVVSCIYGITYSTWSPLMRFRWWSIPVYQKENFFCCCWTVGRLQPRSGSDSRGDSPTELVLHAWPLYCRL